MHVYIVFAHPSKQSFTWRVLQSFTAGLAAGGHTYDIGDLYAMDFRSDMDLGQYNRETGMNPEAPVPEDVEMEQKKIDRSDALVFIYPLWWSDCPAKLKGWFDRVFSYGYAYTYENGDHTSSKIAVKKALVLCPAGHPNEYLEKIGIAESMRRVMVQDRLLGVGIREASLEILGGMVQNDDSIRDRNLKRAFECGRDI